MEPGAVEQLLRTLAAQLPTPPVWIAFDTVSQTSGGADENAATDMRDYLHALDRLRQETGAFVQAIHHSGKDESRGARGSSVFLANCDTVLRITQSENGVCILRSEKQRGGTAPCKPFAFRIEALALEDEAAAGDAQRTGPVLRACEAAAQTAVQPSVTQTMEWLRNLLSDGEEHTSVEVEAAAEAVGISRKILRTARERLGIVMTRVGSQWSTRSIWSLPAEDPADAASAPTRRDVSEA